MTTKTPQQPFYGMSDSFVWVTITQERDVNNAQLAVWQRYMEFCSTWTKEEDNMNSKLLMSIFLHVCLSVRPWPIDICVVGCVCSYCTARYILLCHNILLCCDILFGQMYSDNCKWLCRKASAKCQCQCKCRRPYRDACWSAAEEEDEWVWKGEPKRRAQ